MPDEAPVMRIMRRGWVMMFRILTVAPREAARWAAASEGRLGGTATASTLPERGSRVEA